MNTFPKTLAALGICLTFASCSFYTPQFDTSNKSPYDISLREVVTPSEVRLKYGEQRITREDSGNMHGSVFENDIIRIFWVPTEISMAFTLENKMEDSLEIQWGDAAYVNEEGMTVRVTHGGVKYGQFYYPTTWPRGQKSSMVVGKGKLSDMVLPLSNTHAAGGTLSGTGYVTSMLPKEAKAYVGKAIQVLLPMKMKGTVIEYIFVFDINGAAVEE